MASAGAAERDGQITLPFTDVMRNQVVEQALDAPQKFAGLRERANVAAHLWILAGKFAQARNEMRIRQKAHIENQVGVASARRSESRN